MSEASKRGKRNRAKGGRYEAEVAKLLTSCGIPASREGHKQRRKRDREGDVHAPPFVVECKTRQRLNAHDALLKLREEHEGIPVLFWKRPQRIEGGKVSKKKHEIVCMNRDDFLAMAAIFRRVMRDAAAPKPDCPECCGGEETSDEWARKLEAATALMSGEADS